jgi:sulfur carrier protein
MQIRINGQPRDIPDTSLSVADLVARLELAGKRIAVERNGEVVPKSRHGDTAVCDGDRFEIIVAVGGG